MELTQWTVCEKGATPDNCTTATVTVVVNNPIVAEDDKFDANGGNVLGNDTLNGNPVTKDTVEVTPDTEGPLTIDAEGNVTVAPNTPSGTKSSKLYNCNCNGCS